MANLSMTVGDYRQFQLTVTKNGSAVDLTAIRSLNFTLQQTGGLVLATWGLTSGVAVTNAMGGIAVLTVTPAMLSWATGFATLSYTWSLIDAVGNPTLGLDMGVFQLTAPP